jgi:hypothetical protein
MRLVFTDWVKRDVLQPVKLAFTIHYVHLCPGVKLRLIPKRFTLPFRPNPAHPVALTPTATLLAESDAHHITVTIGLLALQ